MIIVITYTDRKTGYPYISHGYCTETDRVVILPDEPAVRHCYFDSEIGEWILK